MARASFQYTKLKLNVNPESKLLSWSTVKYKAYDHKFYIIAEFSNYLQNLLVMFSSFL